MSKDDPQQIPQQGAGVTSGSNVTPFTVPNTGTSSSYGTSGYGAAGSGTNNIGGLNPFYIPPSNVVNGLGALGNSIDQLILRPANQRIHRRRQAAASRAAAPEDGAAPQQAEKKLPQPSNHAKEIGLSGVVEELFANGLDGHKPIFSPKNDKPSRLEARVRKSVAEAEEARHQAEKNDFFNIHEAYDARNAVIATEKQAKLTREEVDVAKYILTVARRKYASLVNNDRVERLEAARFVAENIEEANEVNGNVLGRHLPAQYHELTKTLDADAAGTLPYQNRNVPFEPYVIPENTAWQPNLTPGEKGMNRVGEAGAHIAEDLNGLKNLGRTKGFNYPIGVSPKAAETFLTGLNADMQDDGILNQQSRHILNFVPIDHHMLGTMHPDIQHAVDHVTEVLQGNPTRVDEHLAKDIEIVADVLTGKKTELTTSPPRTPSLSRDGYKRQPKVMLDPGGRK